jgi:hypothetical protein
MSEPSPSSGAVPSPQSEEKPIKRLGWWRDRQVTQGMCALNIALKVLRVTQPEILPAWAKRRPR